MSGTSVIFEDTGDETPARDSVVRFGVQVETETYVKDGRRRRDYQVVITFPDSTEESGTFPTDVAAEMWIGERIITNAEAIIKASR